MDAQAALDASSDVMVQGFAEVAAQLADVRRGLQDLVARLGDLDSVLNDQRAQGRVADIVRDAAHSLADRLATASAAAAPSRVIAAAVTASNALTGIESRTRMLDAVANLSLITARSLRLDGFDAYVRNLRALGDAMGQDAVRLGDAVMALRLRRERAGAEFARAARALDEVLAALDADARDRAATDRLLGATLDGVASLADRLPRMLATETDTLVQAMQFADEAMQRLDHARTILARGGAAEGALAAAQVEALVGATRERVASVKGSLARIEAGAADAGRVLSAETRPRRDAWSDAEGGANPAHRAVDLGRALLTSLADASTRALDAIEGAAAESAALSDLATEAETRFASVVAATEAIHIAAINAALLSRTESGQERAMSVLSVDVQQQAASCARASETCRAAMAELTVADDLSSFASVSDRAQAFRRSVAETTGAIDAADAALADMGRLREAAANSLQSLGPAV